MKRRGTMKWLSMLVLLGTCTILSGCGNAQDTFDRHLTVASERYCEPSRYITFTNNSKVAGTLEGWEIWEFDSSPSLPDIVLEPGKSLKVWSGKGTSDEGNYYLMRERDQWALSLPPPVGYLTSIYIEKAVEHNRFWEGRSTITFISTNSLCP
jgi:hypothetical protein